MKNIFAVGIEKDELPEFYGKPFLTDEIDDETHEKLMDFSEEEEATTKKYTLPLPLRIICYICLIAGAFIVLRIISSLPEISITQAYENAPALFYIGPSCLVVGLGLFLFSLGLRRKAKDSDEFKSMEANAEELVRKSQAELGVPADALQIDVVFALHKLKNGVAKAKANAYALQEHSFYLKNENMCFADISTVISVPLSSVRGVRYVKKRITCTVNWNKEEKPRSPRYKKYVMINNIGIVLKGHYVIEVVDVRGEYEILIPAYDFDAFSEATGYRVAYTEELN